MDVLKQAWEILMNPDASSEVGNKGTKDASSSSYDEGEEEGETTTGETDSSYDSTTSSGEMEEVIRPTDKLCIIRQIISDDSYFKNVPHLTTYMDLMLTYFRKFTIYSPITCVHKNKDKKRVEFTTSQMKGLEYLLDMGTKFNEFLEFPCIHLEEKYKMCKEVTFNTFLVSRFQDHIFSYVIELALIGTGLSKRLPASLYDKKRWNRKCRMHQYKPCTIEHNYASNNAHYCPLEWVLYTRKNSEFFRYCQQRLDQNQFIRYDVNESYLNFTPISFYLVSLLCGPLRPDLIEMKDGGGESTTIDMTREGIQVVSSYEEWVIVPLYFIDLWNTRSTGIQTYDSL
jgi:hypothetical protein